MSRNIILSDNSLWSCMNFRGYIINRLISDGYNVIVVAPNDSFICVEIPENIVYEPINIKRNGVNPFNELLYLLKLLKIYKRYSPEIIFHYTIKPNVYGSIAAKILGLKSVCFVTGLGYVFENKNIQSRIAKFLYKIGLLISDKSIFLNTSNLEVMVRERIVSREKTILLKGGEGIDLNEVSATKVGNNEKVVFLMVARVLYEKGYSEFVHAARHLKHEKFQLIGQIDKYNPSAVAEDIVRNETAIEYLGFMSKDEMFEKIENCTCVVLPSYHEGMSITLVESIAKGRPIICSDIPGCKETVDDCINGYLVPKKDPQALSEACTRFMNLSYEYKKRMGEASRSKAEAQFDINDVYKMYVKILNSIGKKAE